MIGGGPPGPGPMGPGPGPMGPGPMGPSMSGPGPGPYPGPPRGFGPMGPGPMPPRGPMRPPMHPMGPGPGPDFNMGPGPAPVPGGPQEPSGGGMYGVSSGEAHKSVESEDIEKKKDPEDDKPKVVYASAPQIVVPLEKKEKKRKRKRKDKVAENNSDNKDNAKEDSVISANVTPEISVEIPATVAKVEPQEDFQLADMEIDTSVVPVVKKEKKEKKKKFIRFAAGQAWEDQTLSEWDQGIIYGLCHSKMCLWANVNSDGPDLLVHPHSLIRALLSAN